MKRAVIIVAGGQGVRMGAEVPKQFLPLAGQPVLMHAIRPFFRFDADINILLVLPAGYLDEWQRLCTQHALSIPHTLVTGGATRFDSVKNALAVLPDTDLVAVHDGVRPLVSQSLIARCFGTAEEYGSAIPALPVVDSLRLLQGGGCSLAVPREAYRAVQTPQVFRADWLREAYGLPYQDSYTDDASVLEATGFRIRLIEGCRENRKITDPLDLRLAELCL